MIKFFGLLSLCMQYGKLYGSCVSCGITKEERLFVLDSSSAWEFRFKCERMHSCYYDLLTTVWFCFRCGFKIREVKSEDSSNWLQWVAVHFLAPPEKCVGSLWILALVWTTVPTQRFHTSQMLNSQISLTDLVADLVKGFMTFSLVSNRISHQQQVWMHQCNYVCKTIWNIWVCWIILICVRLFPRNFF